MAIQDEATWSPAGSRRVPGRARRRSPHGVRREQAPGRSAADHRASTRAPGEQGPVAAAAATTAAAPVAALKTAAALPAAVARRATALPAAAAHRATALPAAAAHGATALPAAAAHRATALPAAAGHGAAGAARHLGRAVTGVLASPTLRGVAMEAAWISTHTAHYPLGLLAERTPVNDRLRMDDLSPVQRALLMGDVEAAGTPILLLHGMVDNRSVFALLQRGLRRRGFGQVLTRNYSPVTNDVRDAAADLAALVEEVVAETGYERLHIVGHSLGGLMARYYVQRLGGDERVHTLVTLGTPHSGTAAAHLLPSLLCRQLRPGSDLYAELDEPAPGCRTRFVAYWSDLDQMVHPRGNAQLEHADLDARSVLIRGRGHMSLPIAGPVVRGVCDTLSDLDPDGSTLREGATPLGSASRHHHRHRRSPAPDAGTSAG